MDFDFGKEYADKSAIPAQFQSLYEEKEGGGLQLVQNETVKGAVEAIIGLNKALGAARVDAKKAKDGRIDLSALSEWGDSPEAIKAAFATKVEELEGKIKGGVDAKVEVDRVRKDLTTAHETVVGAKDEKIRQLTGQLQSVLIDGQVMQAIAGVANDPELLAPFVKRHLVPLEENGEIKVVVIDDQKNRRYSTTGGDLTISELVTEMKANEKYGVLFKSEAPSGSNHRPGTGNQLPHQKPEEMSSLQKIAAGLGSRTHGSPVPAGMK